MNNLRLQYRFGLGGLLLAVMASCIFISLYVQPKLKRHRLIEQCEAAQGISCNSNMHNEEKLSYWIFSQLTGQGYFSYRLEGVVLYGSSERFEENLNILESVRQTEPVDYLEICHSEFSSDIKTWNTTQGKIIQIISCFPHIKYLRLFYLNIEGDEYQNNLLPKELVVDEIEIAVSTLSANFAQQLFQRARKLPILMGCQIIGDFDVTKYTNNEEYLSQFRSDVTIIPSKEFRKF